MRARLYRSVFARYRRAPFNSRRAGLWWWLSCKIERERKTHIRVPSVEGSLGWPDPPPEHPPPEPPPPPFPVQKMRDTR